MTDRRNRDHWDQLGSRYEDNWAGPRQQDLAARELSFVVGNLPDTPGQAVLDVGVGSGRVLGALLAEPNVGAAYGVDVAPAMVRTCEEKFGGHPKLKDLVVCDVANGPLPVPDGLSFVSAVRMLKYSPSWWEIVETTLAPHLAVNGVLVFSMPNNNSMKRVSRRYDVPYYKTTRRELERRLAAAHLEILGITGFTKLPDLAYRHIGRRGTDTLLPVERLLDRLLGRAALSLELFVAARRTR